MRRFYVAIALPLLASLTILAQTQSPKHSATQPQKPEKKSLKPAREVRLKYAKFLKSQHTGLFLLLPREKFDPQVNGRHVVTNIPGDAPPNLGSFQWANGRRSGDVQGGGAFYSFTYRTHAYGDASHLLLEQGHFLVGFAGANYGFLTNLGDVRLESVSLNTPAANWPATYKRATYIGDARKEQRRFGEGVVVDGITFKQRLPLIPNSTYVLRAINYDNSDVLVAFRVVEVESDGTALILWKLLKRYSTPQVER